MRPIDADELENTIKNAIDLQRETAKQYGLEKSGSVELQIAVMNLMLALIKKQPTIKGSI